MIKKSTLMICSSPLTKTTYFQRVIESFTGHYALAGIHQKTWYISAHFVVISWSCLYNVESCSTPFKLSYNKVKFCLAEPRLMVEFCLVELIEL